MWSIASVSVMLEPVTAVAASLPSLLPWQVWERRLFQPRVKFSCVSDGMEIGEEERYAAGALFTLALHLTQVTPGPAH